MIHDKYWDPFREYDERCLIAGPNYMRLNSDIFDLEKEEGSVYCHFLLARQGPGNCKGVRIVKAKVMQNRQYG